MIRRRPALVNPTRIVVLLVLLSMTLAGLPRPERTTVAFAQPAPAYDVCGPVVATITVAHKGVFFQPSLWNKIASVSVDLPFERARGKYESLRDPLPSALGTHIWLEPKTSFVCMVTGSGITLYLQYETEGPVLQVPETCLEPDPALCPGGSTGGGSFPGSGGSGGGGDPSLSYLCTWELTFINGVLTTTVLIGCVPI